MRKKIFLAITAAVGLLSSCSSDDLLSSSDSITDNSIVFATSNAESKPTTRSGVTITSLDKFYATATTSDSQCYFWLLPFSCENGIFKSETPYYWPTADSLNFFAISEYGGSNTYGPKNVPRHTFSSWAGENDLVAATALCSQKKIPYPLTFQHITSQIRISAEAVNKTQDLTYKLVSVEMTAPSSGIYDYDSISGGFGRWTITNSATTKYSYADVLPISFLWSGKANPQNCYWNILPVTDGNISFSIEYQVIQRGKVIADFTGANKKQCTVTKPNLLAGKKYTYNFLLPIGTNDVITFTTFVTNWDDGDTTDIDQITSFNIKSLYQFEVNDTTTMQIEDVFPSSFFNEKLTWETSDTTIATINPTTGLLTGKAIGKVTVTATSENGVTSSVDVDVLKATRGYERYEEWVDLGLPSGNKWATKNVSMYTNKDGEWFCWGESYQRTNPCIEEYYWYTAAPDDSPYEDKWNGINKYQWADGNTDGIWYDSNGNFIGDGKTTLEYDDDPASIWGGNWKTPSPDDFQELMDNCNISYYVDFVGGTSITFSSRTTKRSITLKCYGYKQCLRSRQYGVWKYTNSTIASGSGVYMTNEGCYDTEYPSTRFFKTFDFTPSKESAQIYECVRDNNAFKVRAVLKD